MNAPIVSAEAKARLIEAVKNYTPSAPEKYRALSEVKESIMALRERKASYGTIRVMLHENTGIEVSHQTVARYCREVLDATRAKKPRRPKTPTAEPPAPAQGELAARSHWTIFQHGQWLSISLLLFFVSPCKKIIGHFA